MAPRSAQEIVERYVYLVALSAKEPNEVWPRLDRLNLSSLEWGDHIRKLMKSDAIPTSSITIAGSYSVGSTFKPDAGGAISAEEKVIINKPPGAKIRL